MDECRLIYLNHLRQVAAGRGSKDGGGLDLVVERARLARAQAVKVERENAVADGEYLSVGEIHVLVTLTIANVRARLLAMPTRLAPILAGVSTDRETHDILKKAISDVLNELGASKISEFDHGLELSLELVNADRQAQFERENQ